MGEPRLEQQTVCPLPSTRKAASLFEVMHVLRTMGIGYWLKAVALALGAALIIGLPTVLIPNSLFIRDVETTIIDYVIFVLSVLLIGITWALPAPTSAPDAEKRSLWGAAATFFAVGCPTCNKIVLILLGSSGALTYFAPLQPLLGIGAIVLIIAAWRRRLGQLVPTEPSSAS